MGLVGGDLDGCSGHSVSSGSSGTACICHTGELTSTAESEVGLGWVETVGSGAIYF